jgi:hypothetical protein
VFPPRNENTSRAAASGDTVVIEPGSYRIGCQNAATCRDVTVNLGTNGGAFCDPAWPYDCFMGTIPSGVTVLGCSAGGCPSPGMRPELWGAGGVRQILDAYGTTNVTLKDLILTDHAALGNGHPSLGGYPATASMLRGQDGVIATGSRGLRLTNVYIHGLWRDGIRAGSVANLRLDGQTRVDFNASSGINFDTCDNNGTCGVVSGDSVTFEGADVSHIVSVSWNGCIEDPGNLGNPVSGGCYNDGNGGYGDGVGTSATSGIWTLRYTRFEHNTSDGLDLLYGTEPGCSIAISNSYLGGNAGNQLKTCGTVLVRNSLVEGDCDFFEGKTFTLTPFSNCRAGGDAVATVFAGGNTARFYGNTIANIRGNDAFLIGPRNQAACTAGNTLDVRNAVIVSPGRWSGLGGGSPGFLYRNPGCDAAIVSQASSVVHGFSSCPPGTGIVCADPQLVQPILDSRANFYLSETSPARDLGDETAVLQGTSDFNAFDRGTSWDAGGLEFGSPKVAVTRPVLDNGPAIDLKGNVPNPFQRRTEIGFVTRSSGFVSVDILDLSGRRVRTLAHGQLSADRYLVSWDAVSDTGRPVSSGLYWVRVTLGATVRMRRLLLVR